MKYSNSDIARRLAAARKLHMIFRVGIIMAMLCTPYRGVFASDLVVADNGVTAGYMTLAWPSAKGEQFLLEIRQGTDWIEIYRGPDRATTLSGLRDGTYEYRLSTPDGPTGDPLSISIKHHPLDRAWLFFALGACMFVALLGALFVGSRQKARQA